MRKQIASAIDVINTCIISAVLYHAPFGPLRAFAVVIVVVGVVLYSGPINKLNELLCGGCLGGMHSRGGDPLGGYDAPSAWIWRWLGVGANPSSSHGLKHPEGENICENAKGGDDVSERGASNAAQPWAQPARAHRPDEKTPLI